MFLPDAVVNPTLDLMIRLWPSLDLCLSSTEPVMTPTGYDNITEPTAASYAPVPVAADDWQAATDRALELDVIWPDLVDDLGVIEWWVLRDSGGVPQFAGRFGQSLDLAAGTSNIVLPLRIESPSSFTELV